MSRYIDADKALQCAIEEKRFFIYFEDAFNQQFVVNTIYSDLADFLNSQPTADVVEVVRCKDCLNAHLINNYPYCELWNFVMARDNYCSFGKRKENE